MPFKQVKLLADGEYHFSVKTSGELTYIGGSSNPFHSVIHGNIECGGSGHFGHGDVTQTLKCEGDIIAYLNSDIRWKENLIPIQNALEKVKTLSGYTYRWNEKSPKHKRGTEDVGVVAQEVEKVLPEAIRKDPKEGILAVEYVKIIPLLIESIKELQKEVEDLKGKL